MALIETWLNCDTTKLVTVKALDGNVFSADNEGNLIGVYVSKKGQPVELSGSVIGYVIRPDGETVAVPGSLSGNRAWIVLPLSAYAVVGQISIAIRIVNGSEKTVLAACTGYVNRTTTDTIIDPGHIIPSLEELLAQIEACETATTAATTAAGAANMAASNADAKAALANTAAGNADAKATLANTAAGRADDAAGAANTAASNADAKAALANTAAGNADAKATLANTAAGRADDAAAALENMTATATGLAAEFDALAEEVDQKAPAVFKTIESAPIATFDDGADDMSLKDLKVAIEPVQDLHGYDHPWPAGGWKNKFPITVTTQTKNGTTFTVASDGAITVSGTPTELTRIALNSLSTTLSADMKFSMTGSATGVRAFCRYNNSGTVTYPTISPSANLLTGATADQFTLEVNTTFAGTATFKFQLEEGATATDWAPYENICPISGWTGAKVTRTGANLLPHFNNIHAQSGLTFSVDEIGRITVNGTATSTVAVSAPLGTFIWDGVQDVWLSGCPAGGSYENGYSLRINGEIPTAYSKPDIGNGVKLDDSSIVNRPISFGIVIRGGTVCNNLVFAPMLNLGLSAQSYEPYQGQTYEVAFPSEAGTVYGGTLDVASGVLTVDRAEVDLGTVPWTRHQNKSVFRTYNQISGMSPSTGGGIIADFICDSYKTETWSHVLDDPGYDYCICEGWKDASYIAINDSRYNDYTAEQFQAAMSGVHIVYNLATPVTYQLTPQEISTMLGVNNIWADTGDINLLTYPVDTAIKVESVDKRIASVLSAVVAPVLTDMIADTALAVNQFRIVNDTLYKVTAPIASGGILTPGTNVIATSIGEQITALLNA